MIPVRRLTFTALATLVLLFASTVALRHWWGERLVSRAGAERDLGNDRGAAALYRRAVRCGKDEAAVALAEMAFHRKEWDDVRRYGARAAAMNPLQGYVHILMCYAREAQVEAWNPREVESVLQECRRAVLLAPTDGASWRSYADMALRLYGREVLTWGIPTLEEKYRKEAVEAYRGTMEADPRGSRRLMDFLTDAVPEPAFLVEVAAGSEETVLEDLVFQLLKKGKWKEAERSYREAASASPLRRTFYLAAAEAHRRAGLHAGEKAWLRALGEE